MLSAFVAIPRLMRAAFWVAIAPITPILGAEFSAKVIDARKEPVTDAVVALIPLEAPVPPVSVTAAEIIQKNQEFIPYLTVVQSGTTVVFPNQDNVQHHVYSLSKAKKFELPLYDPGQAKSFVFDVSGTVTLGCNIHDWMIGYLVVVPTPYFARSDGTGAAAVAAPAGRYRVEVIHPRATGPVSREIALALTGAVTAEFSLTLKPERRVRRGPDGKAGGYR